MRNVTDMLREDHKTIDLMLNVLEDICRRLESGNAVEPEHLDDIVAFMRDFVVAHNAFGESLALYAAEEAGRSIERGSLIVMSTERNTFREYTASLQEAVTKYRKGQLGATEQVVHIARAYIAALRRQMEMEEKDIYPRLDIYLSTAEQRELADRLERSATPAKQDALQRLSKIKDAHFSVT